MITLEDLIVDKLPARADVTARVLCTVDDPNSSAADLARVVGTDPALASRTLALANSAYYGLSRRVATMDLAVSVLGFDTVRALALTIGTGLERPGAAPDQFWEQAAMCATAASVLAPRFEAPVPQAFCVGLLHTIGSALLHQVCPVPALCLPFPTDTPPLAEQEIEIYGYGHAEVGARVLARWNFPPALCALIADHHDDLGADASPLARTLHAARACTDSLLRESHPSDGEVGRSPGLPPAAIGLDALHASEPGCQAPLSLLTQIRERAEALRDSLTALGQR